MSLQAILQLSESKDNRKQGMSQERIKAQMDDIRALISFFRWYPDLFVDFIKGPDSTFNFFTYQRVFLRAVMRHRYTYATFPRAYSKSFLSMMALMIKCILFPNSHEFVTTGGKEQAASITTAKIEQICNMLPCLQNEINWQRGVTTKSRDNVRYVFKNGSIIDVLAAKQSSRGQRRTNGLMEECVLIEKDILNEIIIPTTNIDRQLPDGTFVPRQINNKSQIYITTAGWKNSFAYEKLIQLLIQSIIQPDEAMILGGTYEIPILEGLQSKDFIDQLKISGTYNQDSFDRQYKSVWSGDAENAFFSSEKFDKYRILLQSENQHSGRSSKNAYYVIGVDVGRYKCTTEAVVIKVTPQPGQAAAIKSIVNLYSYQAEDFEEQAINIKKLYFKYKARMLAIDANGVGAGFVDFMTKNQVDPETGDNLPPFGVDGGTFDDAVTQYKNIKGQDVVDGAMYLIKANAPINTQAYAYAQAQISNGKVKFLITEKQAKTKLLSTKVGQNMSPDQRASYLQPFVLTDALKMQMLNLVQDNQGFNIILKQSSRSISKDRFSAFIYGLYYIKQEEDRNRRRKKRNINDFLFFS